MGKDLVQGVRHIFLVFQQSKDSPFKWRLSFLGIEGTNGALCSLTKTKRFNNKELYYDIMENEETVEGQIKNHIRGLVNRLEGWIYGQKKLLDDLNKYGDYASSQDRFALLLSAQAMLFYIERTVKDFESWLSNPLITSVMTIDMLKELEEKLRQIAVSFIQVDVEHTGSYMELLKKMDVENAVPELLRLYFEQKGNAQNVPQQQTERREIPRFL